MGRIAHGRKAITEYQLGDQIRAQTGSGSAAGPRARRRLRSGPAHRENSGSRRSLPRRANLARPMLARALPLLFLSSLASAAEATTWRLARVATASKPGLTTFEVLESNAEEFVKSYVQKGGE